MSTNIYEKRDFISSHYHVLEIGIVIKFVNVVGQHRVTESILVLQGV